MSVGSISSGVTAVNVGRTQDTIAQLLAQLATGTRITSASVDPAGLSVFNELDTASSSTRQAVRNTNDGISVVQTAESATSGVQDNLQRMRELAMQASSGTLNDTQRADLNSEFSELAEGIDAIADSTEFNGVPLTDGSVSSIDVQVGTGSSSSDQVSMGLADLSTGSLGLSGVSIDSQGGAQSALDAIDTALSDVSSQQSELGATQNRLESSIAFGEDYANNLEAAASTVMDLDFALATSQLAQNNTLMEAGIAAMVQANNLSRSSVGSLLFV
jgi:flagellin